MIFKKTGLSICLALAGIFAVQTVAGQGPHPHYMHALADLRSARWLLAHTPGNWRQSEDEKTALKEIEGAIKDIKDAAIDDGKDMDFHPHFDFAEHNDRQGRLNDVMMFLKKTQEDLNHEEDNGFARGLRNKSFKHVEIAMGAVNRANTIDAKSVHPNYLAALADLRATRWLLAHTPGNWKQTDDERAALREIEGGIKDIKSASIDDGKNLDEHPHFDFTEHTDRQGRLNDALTLLKKTQQDLSKEEDNAFAGGLRNQSMKHVEMAMGSINKALTADAHSDHPSYLNALSNLRAARWMLYHTPGNWKQTEDERTALRAIEDGIKDIKEAAIDDGKNIDDHPSVQEASDRNGRLNGAMDFLRRAKQDLSREEDNGFARGLRNRSIKHVDDALGAVNRALNSDRPMRR